MTPTNNLADLDLTNFLGSSFLQTTTWEQFQQSGGVATYWLDGTLFIKHPLRWSQNYWYAPRVSQPPTLERLDALFKTQTSFIKLELQHGTLEKPFVPAPTRQPRQTAILDLRHTDDELLNGCKTKTRYNIRLAQRKGVTVERYDFPDSQARLSEFLTLITETNLRDQIKSYEHDYYHRLIKILGAAGMATLWVAYAEQQPLASLILVRHQGVATYLFGASSNQQRALMAPHLLQWQAIKWAKSQGDTIYDFGGLRVNQRIAPGTREQAITVTNGGVDQPPVKLLTIDQVQPTPGKTYGVTKFKLGFNGLVYVYPPSYDRFYKPFWYNMYKTYHRVNKHSGFAY